MATVRALDSGTLTLEQFIRFTNGQDLKTITDPIGKLKEIERLKKEIDKFDRRDKKRKRIRK